MAQSKPCGRCQSEFVGRPNQLYCSTSCKRQAQQERDLGAARPAQNRVVAPEPYLKTANGRRLMKKPPAPVQANAQPDPLGLAIQAQDPILLKMHLEDNEKERRHQRHLLKSQHKHERSLHAASTPHPRPVESVAAVSPQEPLASVTEAVAISLQQEPPVDELGMSLGEMLLVGGLAYGAYRLLSPSAPKPHPKQPKPLTGLDGLQAMLEAKKAPAQPTTLASTRQGSHATK